MLRTGRFREVILWRQSRGTYRIRGEPMYGVSSVVLHSVPTTSSQVCLCATMPQKTSCSKDSGTVLSCRVSHYFVSFLSNLCHRTLYESKGLEFNDVSHTFLLICPRTDEAKVLLYNFFKDSPATPKQWRLMLNEVSNASSIPNIPAFDETRHASICVEVCCLWLGPFFLRSLMFSGLTVEIFVCRNHSGSEQPLDRRQF